MLLLQIAVRVFTRKTFAERNAKFVFRCASVLGEKTAICAIIRKSHYEQNFPIPLFCNSSFARFRNSAILLFNHACVFLEIKRFLTGI